MDTLLNGPVFPSDLYDVGDGCSWRFTPPPDLSVNDWFIAGPAPGVYRDEWLKAAISYRARARAGQGRVLFMDSARGAAWLRPGTEMAEALNLSAGDSLFLGLRARAVGADTTLVISFGAVDSQRSAPDTASVTAGAIAVPGDGAWHDLDATLIAAEPNASSARLRPIITVTGGAVVELSGLILGVEDGSAMAEVGRLVRCHAGEHYCRCVYHERETTAWEHAAYTCHFTFAYDLGFYTPEEGYQAARFLDDMERRLGGIDALILWPAYPRIGVDDRNQFDFFRDMPGGLEGLRTLCAQFRDRGIRVIVPYLPWDTGTRRESLSDEEALAWLVRALDADGIHLDTLSGANRALRLAMDEIREGIALIPELCTPVDQLSLCSMSWAQYAADPDPPGMPLLKWVEPRHIQHFTRRWETSHAEEIETAFFNGSGLLVWENIFGTSNPFAPEDALRWRRCAAILRTFTKNFTSDLWDPFYPSIRDELSIHRWPGAPTTIFTLRNTGEPIQHARVLRWQLPQNVRGDNLRIFDLWNGRRAAWEMTEFGVVQVWSSINRLGCLAVSFSEDPALDALIERLSALDKHLPEARERATVSLMTPKPVTRTVLAEASQPPEGMVLVPSGTVRMRLEHRRRECGCYPDPGTPETEQAAFYWGTPDDVLNHDYRVDVSAFFVDEAQVSNADFRRFLDSSGYTPNHTTNFLKHWPGGVMPEELALLPVTYVDLDDARAYARWAGKRLPSEPEWQFAAQGEDGRLWPWGDAFDPAKCTPPGAAPLPVRSLPEGRSHWGCYHLSGNVWEWTESERDDGSTRFCIIRGGSYFVPTGSDWYVKGGPQPLNTHTKFLLMWPGLDRCATVGFRCVKDAAPGA